MKKYFKIIAFGLDKTFEIKKLSKEQYDLEQPIEVCGTATSRVFDNGDESMEYTEYLLNTLKYKLEPKTAKFKQKWKELTLEEIQQVKECADDSVWGMEESEILDEWFTDENIKILFEADPDSFEIKI